eukprot:c624_g1_i1.p1 GENE.c624_g1_i1~~c624_g1_i1.p1  ORF type:complete len:350 (-),score=56.38 c624_g1_i1:43-1092(-)
MPLLGTVQGESSGWELCGLGLLMGVVHVLSGADHICVLAALSVNGSWRAFFLGTRWAIGHSLGLFIVAVVFISLKGSIDLKTMEAIGMLPVGMFMCILGIGVVWKGFSKRRNETNQEQSSIQQVDPTSVLNYDWDIDAAELGKDDDIIEFELADVIADDSDKGQLVSHVPKSDAPRPTVPIFKSPPVKSTTSSLRSQATTHTSSATNTDQDRLLLPSSTPSSSFPAPPTQASLCSRIYACFDVSSSHTKQRIVALLVGIVAGVAGPGGVLGVFPAIVVSKLWKSMLYLFSFFFTSTLSMGLFAASYGALTQRFASSSTMEFVMTLFSGSLSLVVGFLLILFYFLDIHVI